MLGGVIHLKSRPAETSKRILRGMVEWQELREITSPFSGHPTRTTIKVTLGYPHHEQSVPDGNKNLIAAQDLRGREDGCLAWGKAQFGRTNCSREEVNGTRRWSRLAFM
jgi:hypothetical protein